MNNSDRTFAVVLRIPGIVVFLLLVCPTFVAADGMAFFYRPASSLEPLEVGEQRAIIGHKDGIQRMFIAINVDNPPSAEDASRAAVWMFPVPGSPASADVDVTDYVPDLTGKDVERAFRMEMKGAIWVPLASQPHLVPFALFFLGAHASKGMLEGTLGVTTHKKVERWGIHGELITADSVEHLADYLRKKRVEMEAERLSPFAPYLSDKYALVVAWISSYEELVGKFPQFAGRQGNKQPSLYVEFPTDRPFYPMRPTSGYGKKVVTVSLYLVGLVTPDTSSWPASEKKAMFPDVNYYAGEREEFHKRYRAFFSAQEKGSDPSLNNNATDGKRKPIERFLEAIPEGDVPFTRVSIRAPAENFTQDLWFSPNVRVQVMHYIVSSVWAQASVVTLLLVVFSLVSAGVSGMLVFGKWKPWVRIGLWNCLTIVAVVIATWVTRRDHDREVEASNALRHWDSLVFGALVCVPLLKLFGTFYLFAFPSPHGRIPQVLLSVFIAVEVLIAAWIASKAGSARLDGTQPTDEVQRVLIPRDMKKSFIRVALMFSPMVAVIPLIFFLRVLDPLGFIVALIPISVLRMGIPLGFMVGVILISLGWLIVFSGLIAAGPFAVSWIVRKVRSAWPAQRDPGLSANEAVVAGRKPEALILGALTCIVAVLMILSVLAGASLGTYGSLIRVACFGLITVQLFMATWVVWKGGSLATSEEARVSTLWPVASAGLLPLLAVCGIVTYMTADLLRGGPVISTLDGVNITAMSLLPAIGIVGLIVLIGFVWKRRIRRYSDGMTYRRALSPIFVVLGVLSYFAALEQLLSVMATSGTAADSLAVLALISATWLVKGELQERPTRALRFGVVFSVVFALVNYAAFIGLRALLASVGI